jgi:SulP family sulfate permease
MCAETAAVDIKKEPAGKDSDNSVPARLARHILHENWYTWTVKEKVEFVKTEVLLGITICFAQIPESVAFAFMAHIKPPVALHAAWVVGLICTLLGGRSGMVNGAEGAFAAIISTLVAEPEQPGQNGAGIELLFPSVIVAGAFMGLFWIFKCYKYISLLAVSVMDGFCCGLAIVIGESQLHPFQVGHGDDKSWRSGLQLFWMLLIMIVAMLVMEFVPKLPCKAAKLFPSSLLSILSAILIEYAIVRNVKCDCGDTTSSEGRRLAGEPVVCTDDGFCKTDVIGDVTPFSLTYPYPFFLNDDYNLDLITADKTGQIILQGGLLAIAGTMQGLMTTEVVTEFIGTPANTPAVVYSMSLANLVSGFLGGMGGDAMIGLSTINCLNGGRGRLAPTVTALGIAICVMGGYKVLDFIPVSALAGVMIVVVVHTFKWHKVPYVLASLLPTRAREPFNRALPARLKCLSMPVDCDRWEGWIIIVVSALTYFTTLVYGVGAGLVMAALRFSWTSSEQIKITADPEASSAEHKVYTVKGQRLFFAASMRFHTFFDYEADPKSVELVLEFPPADYSATEALNRVAGKYQAKGKDFKWRVEGETVQLSPVKNGKNGTSTTVTDEPSPLAVQKA